MSAETRCESPLEVAGLSVSFGGVVALDDVSMRTRPASVTGLIGPNGAGKTTFFNAVTGFVRPEAGAIMLGGDDITRMRPDRRTKRGIARTFQKLEIFSSLSVRENVLIAVEARRRAVSLRWQPTVNVDRLIERVGLADVASVQADRLSTGTIRLVEVARALATGPQVLLLDEPSAGLDRGEREALAGLLADLTANDGLSILLVEHDVEFVARVCSYVYVLDFGRLIAEGEPTDVRANRAVQDAYLGSADGIELRRSRAARVAPGVAP